MTKPKYKIGDCIYGRADHTGDNHPGEVLMVEVESARYDDKYGHWVYLGTNELTGKYVEFYEHDIERKLK